MLQKLLLLLALTASAVAIFGFGRQQSIAVRGRLQCNGKPYSGALVKLYDNNRLGKDTNLGQMKTGRDGSYKLSGSKKEFSNIDPKVNFYHNCNDQHKPCKLKWSINIPSSYISSGSVASKIFDAGVIELAGKYKGQSRDCIH